MADELPPQNVAAPAAARRRTIIDSLDLGNRVIVYYNDGTSDVYEKGRIPSEGGGGTGASIVTANIAAQTAAQSLAEQQRQFDLMQGERKARGDQQQGLAEAEAAGYFRGAPTLSRERLGLETELGRGRLDVDRQNAAFAYYKWLSDTYANPRNIWQTLFASRGAPVPEAVRGLSNTAAASAFTGGQSAQFALPSGGQPRAPQAQTAAATPQYNPATDPNRGTRFEGLSGFNTDGTLRLAPNDPDAQGLMAKYPGRYKIGFARGGITPEPIVGRGTVSGQTYMIGEKGPEGVVPTEYLPEFLKRRRGQVMPPMRSYVIGGVLGYNDEDPYGYEVPAPAPAPSSGPSDPSNPYSNAYDPYASITTPSYGPQVPSGYGNVMTPQNWTQAELAAMIAAADAANAVNALGPTTTTTGTADATQDPGVIQPPTLPPPPPTVQTQQRVYTEPSDITTERLLVGPALEGVAPVIQQPTALPQNGQTSPAPIPGAVTPRDVAPPGTFGGVSGARPTFLPGEDNAGPIQQLLAAGILPPFLSRLMGQARGLQSQGTNQPQRFDVPSDLPIVSRLAALQMSPTERAALESIISAYGIDPADYWAYVDSLSPQGGTARPPLFGTPFRYTSQ